MGKITNASSLNLSGSGLSTVPDYVFHCKNLRSLNLSNNNLLEIPIELTTLKWLKRLDLSGNHIKQVMSKIFELTNLQFLNLGNNEIKTLPKQISELKKLKELHISGNQLTILPKELGELTQIRILNISRNPLNDFPESVLKLKQLTHLWIGNLNTTKLRINEISESLQELKCLYTFGTQTNFDRLDRNTALLTRKKGNALDDLKLLTYKMPDNKISDSAKHRNKQQSRTIFLSYSHQDEPYKFEVLKTLKGLSHIFPDINFEVWSDERIRSGQTWLKEIEDALKRAEIAILLVSRDFLGSDFIMQREVPSLLENAKKEGTVLLNLIVGKSLFMHSKLCDFQCVNDPNEPLKSLSDHQKDVVFTKLAEDVHYHLNP